MLSLLILYSGKVIATADVGREATSPQVYFLLVQLDVNL
jgi:hypothetical protein